MQQMKKEILPKLIPVYKEAIANCDFSDLAEIRFRAGRPMMLYGCDGSVQYCGKYGGTPDAKEGITVTQKDLEYQLSAFCRGSVYAYQENISEGFVTLCGGHRVGVAGRAVKKEGSVMSLRDVSGLNLRIARAFPGCADAVMPYLVSCGRVRSSLIIAPPCSGKTTLLRDAARQLSRMFRVTVVDERSELAAMQNGIPSFDVGMQTDVLDAFPKNTGIRCAIRALSPQVIVTDEIGTEEDQSAICELLKSGSAILASMHGYSIEETLARKKDLLSLFERVILLTGTVNKQEVSVWQG